MLRAGADSTPCIHTSTSSCDLLRVRTLASSTVRAGLAPPSGSRRVSVTGAKRAGPKHGALRLIIDDMSPRRRCARPGLRAGVRGRGRLSLSRRCRAERTLRRAYASKVRDTCTSGAHTRACAHLHTLQRAFLARRARIVTGPRSVALLREQLSAKRAHACVQSPFELSCLLCDAEACAVRRLRAVAVARATVLACPACALVGPWQSRTLLCPTNLEGLAVYSVTPAPERPIAAGC